MSDVLPAVEDIYMGHHPELIFYDQACRLHHHIITCQKKHEWHLTSFKVDRFHYSGHSDHDEFCKATACPDLPGSVDEPPAVDSVDVERILWRHDGQKWQFIWRSSMAETTNSWAVGLGSIPRTVNSIYHNILFDVACQTRNERILRELPSSALQRWHRPTLD
jgi:hypothetical protein